MNRPHRLSIEQLTEPTQLVGDRRALHHASGDRDRRGDKNSDEVAELLQAVIAGPTLVDREVQRRVLDCRRERGREHIPGLRHQPVPLISGKQQQIKGGAIDYPEQVDGEMPPPRQPKSMAQARNAKPRWQSDQIVLSGPNPPLRYRDLEAKPIRPRCAVPPPIKSRMVGQNCKPARMMNSMKNILRKCWSSSHQGKPEVDRRCGLRNAGMALDESRHARKLAQALRDGDQAEQRRSADWKAPQGVDPAPANPNARRNASLGGPSSGSQAGDRPHR